MIIFIENPNNLAGKLLELIIEFSTVSGYKSSTSQNPIYFSIPATNRK